MIKIENYKIIQKEEAKTLNEGEYIYASYSKKYGYREAKPNYSRKIILRKIFPERKDFNVLDLFCGCGGLSKGLVEAGFNIIAGVDCWNKAIDSYKKNFNHLALCRDLKDFGPEEFIKECNERVDIIVGGPPCQGFSSAGRRDIKDPRNSLFMEYLKYLEHFQPKVFLMENVMGILSMKTQEGELVINIIMEKLKVDYNCHINKLYASDFGVPQNRRRVIIIGFRKDLNIFPEDIPVENLKENRPVVGDVLEEIVDKSYYLSAKALAGIQKKKERMAEKKHGFGAQILDLNKPSYTIPARYWKDGYDALVQESETQIRRLTITELKRIQSFPDSYILEGSKKEKIMQIGNAVAPKFAQSLGKYILTSLQENKIK